MKKYCINQPGCLGDLLFTLKIGEELSKKGEVYWKVNPFFWHNGISRIKTSENFHLGTDYPTHLEGDNVENINLCDLCSGSDFDLMKIKYKTVGIDWDNWSDFVKYDRIPEIEHALRQHLGINVGDRFILYNDTYGFDGKNNCVTNTIPKDYPGKIIKLDVVQNITVFDWCWIFENAEEIHTVDTSILYVIETLNLNAKRLVCHPRHYKHIKKQLGDLFKKPWEWIEYDRDTWRVCCPTERE